MQAAAQRILELSALSVMIHKLWIIQFSIPFHLFKFSPFIVFPLDDISEVFSAYVKSNKIWKSSKTKQKFRLEKFSKNPSESSPENRKFQFLFKIMYFGKIFQELSWVMTQIP